MNEKVFVSYSRKDSDFVHHFISKIEGFLGYNFWVDRNGIESGDQFEDIILKALTNAEIILFMYSKNALSSEWVKNEVMFARQKKKKIVPILCDGNELDDWALLRLGSLDCINISDSRQYDKLIKNLKTWLKVQEIPHKENSEESHHNAIEQTFAQPPILASILKHVKRQNDFINPSSSSTYLHKVFNIAEPYTLKLDYNNNSSAFEGYIPVKDMVHYARVTNNGGNNVAKYLNDLSNGSLASLFNSNSASNNILLAIQSYLNGKIFAYSVALNEENVDYTALLKLIIQDVQQQHQIHLEYCGNESNFKVRLVKDNEGFLGLQT